MDHIFGDTDDITFGAPLASSKPQRFQNNEQRQVPAREKAIHHKFFSKRDISPRSSRSVEPTAPLLPELDSLTRLITSMKASFLPKEDDMNSLRVVMFSSSSHADPLMLATRDDETILIGSGF